jgi:hypothetical protein
VKKFLVVKLSLELLVLINRCASNKIYRKKIIYTSLSLVFFSFLVVTSLPPQPLCTSLIKRERARKKGLAPVIVFCFCNMHIVLQSGAGEPGEDMQSKACERHGLRA